MKIIASFIFSVLALVATAGSVTRQPNTRARVTNTRQERIKKSRAMPNGTWGGPHVHMKVNASGAEIEFDCAHGRINERIILDSQGRFDAKGTFVPEGGPVSMPVEGAALEKNFAARYRGRAVGGKMTLRVTLLATGNTLDEFSLVYGREPRLVKCY